MSRREVSSVLLPLPTDPSSEIRIGRGTETKPPAAVLTLGVTISNGELLDMTSSVSVFAYFAPTGVKFWFLGFAVLFLGVGVTAP